MNRATRPTEFALMLKRVTLLIIAFFFIVSYTGDISFAKTDSSLTNAKLLKQEEVLQIVQNNIAGYLKTDLQTYGKK